MDDGGPRDMGKDNDNSNGDDNDGKKNGKPALNPLEDFLRRHFPNNSDPARPPAPKIPLDASTIPTSAEAVLTAARLELAAYFNYVADPNNPGIQTLKKDPRYKILDAVWRDDLGDVMATMAIDNVKDFRKRWYWHFPGYMKDVSFLTPAHLVRSHVMAVMVTRHGGDFKAKDSEGCTPLYYLSKHVKDPWVILYMVKSQNVDPYDSGRCTNDYNLDTAKGTKYEEPFCRAIRFGNVDAVNGFLMLADSQDFDPNRTNGHWLQTPLMLAVQEANDCAMTAQVGDVAAQNRLARYQWIIREMAGEPVVNIAAKDIAGNEAADYALHPDVRKAYDEGILARRNATGQPRVTRDPKGPNLGPKAP